MTVAYINNQGGLKSPVSDVLAQSLVLWCDKHLSLIRACHVPGSLDGGTDLLSRGEPCYSDWSLHLRVVDQIWSRFWRSDVDLFCIGDEHEVSYVLLLDRAGPSGVDAPLAHDWPRDLLYASPPLELIHPTLERVGLQGMTVLLVAPAWGSWRSEMTTPPHDYSWPLPLYRDLLQQARGEIFNPRPADLDLWV